MQTKQYLLAILFAILFGCSSDKDVPATPKKKAGTVFQGQIDSLNKAKKVEGTLLKADQDRRKIIDEQSGQ